jgi:hypothetical protein
MRKAGIQERNLLLLFSCFPHGILCGTAEPVRFRPDARNSIHLAKAASVQQKSGDERRMAESAPLRSIRKTDPPKGSNQAIALTFAVPSCFRIAASIHQLTSVPVFSSGCSLPSAVG